MSNHTPGPWYEDAGYICTKNEEVDCIIYVAEMHSTFGPDRYGVHQWMLDPEEYRANARLIAAAPEMVAILQQVVNLPILRYLEMFDEPDRAAGDIILGDLIQQAAELLDKLEGGNNE